MLEASLAALDIWSVECDFLINGGIANHVHSSIPTWTNATPRHTRCQTTDSLAIRHSAMAHNLETPVDVLVCFAHARGDHFPHWMLMLQTQGSRFGTWIHSTGGPTQNLPYTCTIQANKRVDSRGIESTELIGTIPAKDLNKVKAAAKRVQPQQCQMYVVSVVSELEKKGLLPQGTTAQVR